MTVIENYKIHTRERGVLAVPPLPLSAAQTGEVVELLKQNPVPEIDYVMDLFENHISPGVDDAAYVKAAFLKDIIRGKSASPAISELKAVRILGTMLGGYNVAPLIDALTHSDTAVAEAATEQLKNILLVYDYYQDVKYLMDRGNRYAKGVIDSWAKADWFNNRAPLPEELTVTVFKVPGETNTDDLSPASEAFTRSDIPLHANSMLAGKMEQPLETIHRLKQKGYPLVYVGDVVGTGSSRKSGINSLQWHIGHPIPGVPNKKSGGVVIGSTIAPIFFNTAEDSGALPIQANVDQLETGDIITIKPYEGKILKEGALVSEFRLTPTTLSDEVRACGRIPLIIGRNLTNKARHTLGLGEETFFTKPIQPEDTGKGYTLAQRIVGRACNLPGVRPGMYVEPETATVGSQDTTGPMTRDEIRELAALNFGADLVMQSFCHTAAYPKPSDAQLHNTLPEFFTSRQGLSLKPRDGVIHSWLNRLCLPDTVGTGGDSHTRLPLGISFPAGSGLVAFASVAGSMPLNMPESVKVSFKGEMQPGITLRDLVNAIPYVAIKQDLLTVEKSSKKNVFAGRIIEIEGLEDLKVEQAFELSDSSAERSAAACTVKLNPEPIAEYLESNIALIEQLIAEGYEDVHTLLRRKEKMQAWLAKPELLQADSDAEYVEEIEIDMNEITEPIVACPNDPDDVATLTEVLADPGRLHVIDEVFVGSCMTNIGLFRALGEVLKREGQVPARLWVTPPTKMDERKLIEEGYYSVFGQAGARTEVPGCSLCMGNQARVRDQATVFSTSTRNFNNRMGKGAQVYLGSAELAAVTAILGRIPSSEEYHTIVAKKLDKAKQQQVYRYLNFHQLEPAQLKVLVE
ncbi:MAG: bifunctional aconitate hydratase 2/2-methylisocitrate dehydratase [Spirochaetia bacterium]|nr:bifunctional aconitate hydratase 2/2-methylisocitrate dehydratase [Spirochaetia bacterium]